MHDTSEISRLSGLLALKAEGRVVGVGVDHEPFRPTADLRIARFFLAPTERTAATDAGALLRLWTVKEALYKATPVNAEYVLLDYRVADPRSVSGGATGPQDREFRYVTSLLASGFLTVAVCFAGESDVAV